MPTIAVNGTVLHYERAEPARSGQAASGAAAEPLLLLHGGGGTALLHFRNEIPALAARCQVFAPDLRGYGSSSPPRLFPPDFYQQDAADMAALIEALAVGPVHLCGWSDGGIAALQVAADRPELVHSLAVWGAESHILPQERQVWPLLCDWRSWPEHTRERVAAAQGPLNWPGMLERMLVGYNRVLDAGGDIASARIPRISCPTLIMHGDQDDVVPVAHAYELHRQIAGSELRLFSAAGHTLHRERHAEWLESLLAFLTKQPSTTSSTRRPDRRYSRE